MAQDHATPSATGLSEQFYKTRKYYVFYSMILLLWTWIGVTIENNDGTAGLTFSIPYSTKAEVTLPNISNLPMIMILIMSYYAYRVSIEWYSTSPELRANLPAKIDWKFAHTLGLVALVSFGGPELFSKAPSDLIRTGISWDNVTSMLTTTAMLSFIWLLMHRIIRPRWAGNLVVPLGMALGIYLRRHVVDARILIEFAIMLPVCFVIALHVNRIFDSLTEKK